MTAPRLSVRTLSIIAEVVCGNAAADEVSLSPYRRFVDIDAFFEHDLGLESADLESGSRHERAEAWLRRYNATEVLPKIVEAVVGPASFAGSTMEPGPAVAYLNGALKAEGYQLIRVGTGYKLVGRMMVELPTAPRGNPLSDDYVRELADKCRVKLETGDYDGAITNARTLLEVVLGELEEALTGARSDYAGDLPRQYKAVSKMVRLDDDREDLDARFKDVVRGLVTVVNGLAPLRNKLSDGHARVRMPARHHAEGLSTRRRRWRSSLGSHTRARPEPDDSPINLPAAARATSPPFHGSAAVGDVTAAVPFFTASVKNGESVKNGSRGGAGARPFCHPIGCLRRRRDALRPPLGGCRFRSGCRPPHMRSGRCRDGGFVPSLAVAHDAQSR